MIKQETTEILKLRDLYNMPWASRKDLNDHIERIQEREIRKQYNIIMKDDLQTKNN